MTGSGKNSPIDFRDYQHHTGIGSGNFSRHIILRNLGINIAVTMGGTECRPDDGLPIKRHQGQTKSKQGRFGVAQGIDFRMQMAFQFLKRGFNAPPVSIAFCNRSGIGRCFGKMG